MIYSIQHKGKELGLVSKSQSLAQHKEYIIYFFIQTVKTYTGLPWLANEFLITTISDKAEADDNLSGMPPTNQHKAM